MAASDGTRSNGPGAFAPIEKVAISRQAVDMIRQMVLTGQLRPGDTLPPERELAVQLGVSRSSLREAIRALEVVNVLETRHGSGTFVTSMDPALLIEPIAFIFDADNSGLVQLFEARIVIEKGAVELAAVRITDDQLAAIEELVERASGCIDDPQAFTACDAEIHARIAEASGNAMLIKIAASIARLSRESRNRTTWVPTVREHAHRDHVELARQLRAHDPEGAGRAMELHLESVKRGYLEWLAEQEG